MATSPTTVALRHGSFDISVDIMSQNWEEESLKRKREDGEDSDSDTERTDVPDDGDEKLARRSVPHFFSHARPCFRTCTTASANLCEYRSRSFFPFTSFRAA